MPTIPIQIPKREPLTAKMSRMINLQDAIEGRRQNQAAQDIFRNTTDPNQIQTRLRQEGLVEPYMQYAEHLARLDTEQLQQVKARNDILASQRKLLAQNIEGLIHSDPDTAKVLLPSVKKSMEVNGIPSDMLALLPDEYDPKAYQAVLNHLGEFETHQGHLDKAADTLIKQKEEERKVAAEERARIEAGYKTAAEARAVKDQEAEEAGGYELKSWVEDYAGTLNKNVGQLTAQERLDAKRSYGQRTRTTANTPEMIDALRKDGSKFWTALTDTGRQELLPELTRLGVEIPPEPVDPVLAAMRGQLETLRGLDIDQRTEASPGQIVFKYNNRPVQPTQLPESAALRLEGLQTAIQQADAVEATLIALGDTGAVKGFVEENGVYWPVVQDSLTPEQAAAVSETNRLLSAYAQAVSGLAVSEPEIQRLSRSAPSVRLTPGANKVIIGHFKRNARNKLNNYLDLRGWKINEPASGPASPADGSGWSIIEIK